MNHYLRLRTGIGLFCCSFLIVGLFTDSVDAQEPLRNWTSVDGTETIQASLNDYDTRRRMLTLLTANGESIQVPYSKTSLADRRYVKTYLKNLRKGEDKSDSVGNAESETGLGPRSSSQRGRSSNTQTLYGINWTPNVESALAQAKGSDSQSDDQPVMWFRVLGDLEGFM